MPSRRPLLLPPLDNQPPRERTDGGRMSAAVLRTKIKVFFLDGSSKTVSVSPTASALEVCEAVAAKLELQSADVWALYERSKKRSTYRASSRSATLAVPAGQ